MEPYTKGQDTQNLSLKYSQNDVYGINQNLASQPQLSQAGLSMNQEDMDPMEGADPNIQMFGGVNNYDSIQYAESQKEELPRLKGIHTTNQMDDMNTSY